MLPAGCGASSAFAFMTIGETSCLQQPALLPMGKGLQGLDFRQGEPGGLGSEALVQKRLQGDCMPSANAV